MLERAINANPDTQAPLAADVEAIAAEVMRLLVVSNNLTCAWEAGSDAQLKIRDERDQLQARVAELEGEVGGYADFCHTRLRNATAPLRAQLAVAVEALETVGGYDLRSEEDATYRHVMAARTALQKIRGSDANDVPECEICQKLSPTDRCKRDQGDKHSCSGWPDKGGHWRGGGA